MAKSGISRTTRTWLQEELPEWQAEGLIDEHGAEELARRYELDQGASTSNVVFAIYLIGFLLIGGGVLSFIGWNWDRLPDVAKIGLTGSALIGSYGAGFWFWKVNGSRPALGHSLTVLGSFLFGANIGVVAQVFQLHGDPFAGVGLWGAGAALAAWLFRSAPNGILANALLIAWALDRMTSWEAGLVTCVPAIVLIPLAFRLNNRALYSTSILTVGFLLAFEVGDGNYGFEHLLWSLLASSCLALSLTLVISGRWIPFRAISTFFGMAAVIAIAYLLSFHDVGDEISFNWEDDKIGFAFSAPQFVAAVICLLVTLARSPETFRRETRSMIALATAAAIMVGIAMPEPGVPIAIVANLGLAAIGGYAIMASRHSLKRSNYWAGTLLIGLLIVSRFLEFETGLLEKAGFFTFCGIAVIVAGLSFERHVKASEESHAA